MIGVLSIPVLTRPDLLAACVASIDAPVDRLVIIDNGGVVPDLQPPSSVGELIVTRPPANLGYSGSINHVIKTHPDEDWWIFANGDVIFGPGDLDRLAGAMENGGNWVGLTDWRVFGLAWDTVVAVGFWDENFHPCYCEDADYEYRCRLAGVPYSSIPGTTSHVGSVVIQEARYANLNAQTYPANRAYYRAKWGGDLRGGERFTTPFDQGGSVADWRLDLERLLDNRW